MAVDERNAHKREFTEYISICAQSRSRVDGAKRLDDNCLATDQLLEKDVPSPLPPSSRKDLHPQPINQINIYSNYRSVSKLTEAEIKADGE